jgi:hypothetical protein
LTRGARLRYADRSSWARTPEHDLGSFQCGSTARILFARPRNRLRGAPDLHPQLDPVCSQEVVDALVQLAKKLRETRRRHEQLGLMKKGRSAGSPAAVVTRDVGRAD